MIGYTTKESLAGLFILRWEAHFGIDYKPPTSYVRDVWLAERLLLAEGDLAPYCIEALFDKQLAWCNSKTLEWLGKDDKRTQHVRPVAAGLRQQYPSTAQASTDYGAAELKGI